MFQSSEFKVSVLVKGITKK